MLGQIREVINLVWQSKHCRVAEMNGIVRLKFTWLIRSITYVMTF